MDFRGFFKGKRITVMGLAAEGRGLRDAEFALKHGAEVTVTDLKSEEEFPEAMERLRAYPEVKYTLGKHEISDFTDTDLVIRSAITPLESPYVKAAHDAGIPVHTDESLFFELLSNEITTIAITGTRGKSTVTHMIHEILETAGKPVLLGGNVRGTATLPLLEEVQEGDVMVLELDSWKMRGLGEHEWHPNVAVFTTFMSDHMNYYKGDIDQYLDDKANIFKYQTKDDTLVLGSQCADLVKEKYPDIQSNIVIADADDIAYDLAIPGEHNKYNAACAAAAAQALGVDNNVIEKTLRSFLGVPGRLEFVRVVNGVSFYNDTTATMPEATMAAVKALSKRGNVILIMGGADKELDMSKLMDVVLEYTKAVVLLAGSGTDKLLKSHYNLDKGQKPYTDFKLAIEGAMHVAEKGDIILLSPAFASFGMFKNEFDRGDQFNQLVKSL